VQVEPKTHVEECIRPRTSMYNRCSFSDLPYVGSFERSDVYEVMLKLEKEVKANLMKDTP
jgi:hypothetical protein